MKIELKMTSKNFKIDWKRVRPPVRRRSKSGLENAFYTYYISDSQPFFKYFNWKNVKFERKNTNFTFGIKIIQNAQSIMTMLIFNYDYHFLNFLI